MLCPFLCFNMHQELHDKYKGEFCQAIDELANRLRGPKGDPIIAVLLAASQKELTEILSIRNLLDQLRLILILPDSNHDTITRGYSLFPRFLFHADTNFDWVTAVVYKILSNNNGDKRFGYNEALRY